MCFVRANLGGEIVLTTYGRSSGFCVDPIEKKPLNHFLPGTAVLSFGTAGCNLACRFCQNWHISKSREIDTLADQAGPGAIARAAADLGCRSVAFTYNDPVIFHEYAIDVAAACREHGIHTVAVTAGYVCPAPRAEFYRWMDAVNVDLKGFTDSFYATLAAGRLEPVLDTLRYIRHETDTWLEITTLLIPGANDSDTEIHELTSWVVEELGPDVPLHFTAFHPDWRMRDTPPTPPGTLTRARAIALRNGVRYAYTGNVSDRSGQSTYCHACREAVIGRDWYSLSHWRLGAGGLCAACGAPCAGRFEASPGNWGARRASVSMAPYRD
jgi:pyruvate formate lyase activating enzyme